MRKNLIIIFLFLIFPFFVSAYTKEDIVNLVDNKKLCDQETEALYDRYFKLYSRLLSGKDVSQESIDKVYNNLVNALKIIEKEHICSVDDLDRISSTTKNKIYDYLYESSKLIIKSPNLNDDQTTVKYNEDNTVEIYENGEYLDRISLKREEFNYVGLGKYFVYLKYVLPTILVIIFISIFFAKKKYLNNIMIIIFTCVLIINIFYFKYGLISYDLYNLFKSLNYVEKTDVVKMEVKDKKIIKYPSHSSAFASLKIENLNLNLPIHYGESKTILKKGIAFTGSFPGFKGTTILSGHNSKVILNNLKNVKFDDIIIIETNYGKFYYKVSKMEVLEKKDYSKLEKNTDTLIIYTCYPFDEIVYSDKRFVLYAKLMKEEWLNA